MKIKLLVSRAGPAGAQNRGEQIDVDPEEGQRMIEAGQAELVRGATIERAVKSAKAEKAAK